VAREVGFSKIHIFPFSPRRGTLAATMPEQVAPAVKADRARRLKDLETELRDDYFRSLVGRRLQTLVEGPAKAKGWAEGMSCRYAPVEFPAATAPIRQIVDVVAQSVMDGRILASAPALPANAAG
jgi:threonylcarbamoyladenosine tRNA methylthiotransferase MtaB